MTDAPPCETKKIRKKVCIFDLDLTLVDHQLKLYSHSELLLDFLEPFAHLYVLSYNLTPHYICTLNNISHRFSNIISCMDQKKSKFITEILESKHGYQPQDIYFFDDSINNISDVSSLPGVRTFRIDNGINEEFYTQFTTKLFWE
jgi:FMN phosphatase YigB (HAD superfamily)